MYYAIIRIYSIIIYIYSVIFPWCFFRGSGWSTFLYHLEAPFFPFIQPPLNRQKYPYCPWKNRIFHWKNHGFLWIFYYNNPIIPIYQYSSILIMINHYHNRIAINPYISLWNSLFSHYYKPLEKSLLVTIDPYESIYDSLFIPTNHR